MQRWHEFGRFAAILFTTASLAASVDATAQSNTARVALSGHVPSALAQAQREFATRKAAGAPLTVTIVLRRSDQASFERFLADVYDPSSPRFRQFLAPDEVAARFGPSVDDWSTVVQHFEAQGLEVVEGSPNRLTLVLRAPADVVERAFDVALADYRIGEKKFFANDREPSLPAPIAAKVHAVLGLSDLASAQRLRVEPQWMGTDCANSSTLDPFTKDFCKNVYNSYYRFGWGLGGVLMNVVCAIDRFFGGDCTTIPVPPPPPPPGSDPRITSAADADGAGQKVGLVQFDSYLQSDVEDFLALTGAPAGHIAKITQVAVNGGAPPGADQAEVLLDIGAVTTVAPGANVVVYSAPFSGMGSFQAIFNRMIADGVSIISNSWAYCEDQTSAADVQSIDSVLAAAAASGISVLTASGDSGTTCLHRAANTIVVPAGSPHATAVGGTTMKPTLEGLYGTETWWGAVPTPPHTGQGGYGASRFFQRPVWQNGFTSSPTRTIPDLSFSADASTFGVMICQASAGGCPTGLFFGGTSYSAPMIAGLTARLNHSVGQRLGWLNPQLYPLAGTAAFHTPASMGTDFAHVGLGTPNGSLLAVALRGGTVGPPSATLSRVVSLQSEFPADGTTPLSVVVQLRDADGVTVAGRTVSLTANVGSHATITPATATTNVANGTAVFTVKDATVEAITLTATDVASGTVVQQTLTVNAATPVAAAGGINAFPTTVLNDGVASTTITVTLQDSLGRPTPGKLVTLSQGGGHSIVNGPSPPVTDSAGQIQFTATNRVAETVTYTAVDVTDGNLPVPGSAAVTFSGQASASCATPLTAAAGYVATPFATGFLAGDFFYSNVNFGGCPGANNPAFYPSGEVLISSFRTGALYRMPPQGGAANSGQVTANPGQTIGLPIWGKNGKLYAARSATGSGFFSGVIYELDPQTGSVVRTLASGLSCVSPLGLDPISGDLFFSGQCFGAGSNDPNLYRVLNTGGATPTIVVYATLPSSPNGAVVFSPDGTIYVATQYTSPSPPIVRVTGTNQPQPPTITNVPGVLSIFWVAVGETLANGAAKSLIINATDNKLKLADITTNPPTFTELLTTGSSTGSVGPDGCLYISNGEVVYKLTTASGTCGFVPTSQVPAISLTPAIASPNPQQGTTHTLTAKLIGVPPAAGVPVSFLITGANPQRRLVRTDATGTATLAYQGVLTGDDVIVADATVGAATLVSNAARVTWNSGKHATFVSLHPSATNALVNVAVTLAASLQDLATTASSVVPNALLAFNVGGQSCNATTNANGIASCNVTMPLAGSYTLTVTYAGTSQLVGSTASRPFEVLAAGPGPCFAFNDVDVTSPFCPNVEWIRNRLVTLGCASSLYCPNDAVTRLQMAAFMNRLGTALTPQILSVAVSPGALDLDAQPVVCQTQALDTDDFDRRAIAEGSVSLMPNGDLGFAAQVVATFDDGTTWTPLATIVHRGFAPSAQWGHLRASGLAELTSNQTVRFGIQLGRDGLGGNSEPTDSRCRLRVSIASR